MSEELVSQINVLRQSLDEHREELRTLRDAVDELREAIQHLTANLPESIG